jgi:hypothetical protein
MKKKDKDKIWEAAAAQTLEEYHRTLGKRGGKARAKNLTAKQLSAIGKKGAATRWANKPGKKGESQ